MTALEQFKLVCHKYLIINDDEYLDVVFGVIMANRLDSKPVWLYLVGPPSCGKTEILQALSGDEISQISTISAKALISFWEKDSKGRKKENSLLPQINGKVMIIKDFTAMIRDRQETLLAVTGRLRDAYDGSSCRAVGTGIKSFHSKFGIIAAVTNIIDKHRGMLAELGERFLTYRCPEVSEEESTQRCWIVSATSSTSGQEEEIRKASSRILAKPLHKVILSDSFRNKVIEIAQYVAVARCEVMRDPYSKEAEIPTPEIATRLTRQLCDLAIGISVVREERYVSRSTQKLIHKTALDSLTLKRLRLLGVLYKAFPNFLTTEQVTTQMRYAKPTVERWLGDLHLLDLVTKDVITKGETPIGSRVVWKIKNKAVLRRIWD